MVAAEVSATLAAYSQRVSREREATRRALAGLGAAAIVAASTCLFALALDPLDGRGVRVVVDDVRQPPPAPQVTLRPLPVEAAAWHSAPGVPPLDMRDP